MRQLSWLAQKLKDNAESEPEGDLPKPMAAPVTPVQLQQEALAEKPEPLNSSAPAPAPPPPSSAPGNPDPRPDLSLDHVLWVTLFFVARRVDIYIRGLLWCTRYLGAGAEYDGEKIRITPGQTSPADYAQIRAEWMQPHRERIVRILEEAVKTLQGAGVTGAITGAASGAKEVKTETGRAEAGRPGKFWRPPAIVREVKTEPQAMQGALRL